MENTKLDNGQDSIEWERDLEFPYFINKNGQTGWIVDFLDRFYRNVFEMNVKMLNDEKRREFPLAHCKTQAIPIFANALGRLTPHCNDMGKTSRITNNAELLCCFEEQDKNGQEVGNVLMYFKPETLHLDYNDNLKLQCESKKDKVESCSFKIVFFNIYVECPYNNEPEGLFSENFFEEKVWSRIEIPHENFVYSVLDLRSSIHTRKEAPAESNNTDSVVKSSSLQNFLEHSKKYEDEAGSPKVFLSFMVSVAVIEDLRG